MAGKNQRSATLPSSLRHGIQQTEESEGFFSKLKKKFRLKKGRYHVDVNTGDCQNVAPVSFRKRQSREVDDESPWQLRDPSSEEQELRTHSPKLLKQPLGKPTDKHSSGLKGKERKLSNPETYTRSLNSSEISSFQRSSFGAKLKSTNEYSPLTYDTKESVADRSLKPRESALKNEFVMHDDSAIELDNDVEKMNVASSESANVDFGFDPGYEKLPERRTNKTSEVLKSNFDPNYESVKEVSKTLKCESEFDPNYESVDEVKSKIPNPKGQDESFLIEDDPGYQSVKDVKRETPNRTTGVSMRPPKTYSMNQSIESLDEPGYESLNDVKKRIKEQNVDNSGNETFGNYHIGMKSADISPSVEGDEFNDSAIGSVPKSGCLPENYLSRNRSLSGDGSMVTSDSNGGLRAIAETALSLTGIATALTGSGTGKDSGFESKERSLDIEQEENLYSSVKKCSTGDSENPYSMVNKERKPTGGDQHMETVTCEKSSAAEPVSEPGVDGYDSDLGVMLDPGYAECADAIKGIIPYSLYSEGSGSKMSSCTSLDLSAEDFALEPGYAECADAIKSGAIKKISVSHERLVDHSIGTRHDDHKSKGETSSEIYANPQILFRKRSKLIEDGNLEDLSETNEKTEANTDKSLLPEKEICLAVDKGKKKGKKSKNIKKDKGVPLEAPPLPARNYSLYLENEEAEEVVQEVLQDFGKDENFDESSLDEAFEIVESGTLRSETVVDKPDRANQTAEEKRPCIAVEKDKKVLRCQGSLCIEDAKMESCSFSGVKRDTVELDAEIFTDTNDINNADKRDAAHETTESEKVFEGDEDLKNKCSELNEDKTKVKEHEEQCKDNLAKCSGTESCITNIAESDLKEKDNCNKKSDSDCSIVKDKCTQDVSIAKKDGDSMDIFLEVNVKDDSGNVKTLKVVEKQESFKLQQKRKSSRKGTGHCPEVDSVKPAYNEAQFCGECDKLVSDNDDNKDLSHTKDFRDSKSSPPYATKLSETKDRNDLANQEPFSKGNVFIDSGVGKIETSPSPVIIQEPPLMQTVESGKDNIKGIVDGNISAYRSNTSSYMNGLSKTDSNHFLTVAVKMKTISIDSDSDFFNTEDLPKLEINESDLESAFDSSDNSNNLDIETESAGIDKLTQRLKAEDIPEVCSKMTKCKIGLDLIKDESLEDTCLECMTTQTSKGDETDGGTFSSGSYCTRKDLSAKDVQSAEKESEIIQLDREVSQSSNLLSSTNEVNKASVIQNDHALKETYQIEDGLIEDVFDSKTNDRKATLESRLCVIESEIEGESDLSKLIRSYADGAIADIDHVDNELSDDSAIGNINDLQQNNDDFGSDINSAETCCKTSKDASDISQNKQIENNNSDNASSQQLHLIYVKEHPSLYEDSEPTHMTIQEVMGLSPSHDMTVSGSESSEQSLQFAVSPNAFVHINIPNDDQESPPPPRPPPVTSVGQSKSRSSAHGQSSQGKASTPTDEVPPPVRLSYNSGQSDEESPPAIPPRLKSVRATRRSDKVSYSQDFMESMRQLKDCGWYWGPLSWEEAEHKLAKKPEGTFLVRDSSDEHYILSLSFKNQGRVHHTRIEHHKGNFSFWSQPDSHGKSTIKEFIEQCVENSRNGRFLYFIRPSGPGSPPMPIQLLHPVSRFVQMRSLQHMCRFRILQLVRRDHIDHLPVPTRIKQYLKEAQYYVEYLDD